MPLINSLKPGQQLLFIRPMTEGAQNWQAPWTVLVRRRSAQWGAIIAGDRQLVPEAVGSSQLPGRVLCGGQRRALQEDRLNTRCPDREIPERRDA